MFESLSTYKTILVSGPQRSGTTICSRMIAHDLGCRCVDEMEFDVDNIRTLLALVDAPERTVIQCPSLSSCLWLFSRPDTLVVFMMRPVADIVASQNRPIYNHAADRTWTSGHQHVELMKYGRQDGTIAEVKYQGWAAQKPYIRHTLEIEYASLSTHPLWVDASERTDFGPKQVSKA